MSEYSNINSENILYKSDPTTLLRVDTLKMFDEWNLDEYFMTVS